MGLIALRRMILGVMLGLSLFGLHGTADAATAGVNAQGLYALADKKSSQLGYVYLTLSVAAGAKSDALLGATSPDAELVLLVAPTEHGGLATVGSLPIDVQAPLVLQPRGPHFILRGLKSALHPGGKLRLSLKFERAAPADIVVDILHRSPAAVSPQLPKGVKIY